MTITETLDTLQNWFDEHISQKVTLKLPTDAQITGEAKLVHPATFALYVPAKDRIPPNVPAPIPSLCIQLMEGEDRTFDHKRKLNIRICLSAWNPGEQTGVTFYPQNSETDYFHKKYTQGDKEPTYTRNLDGWRDVWNFVDFCLATLHKTDIIEGFRIIKEDGIKYGPFTEDGAIWDYYPYWHSWITFTLEGGLVANVPDYSNFL